MSNHPQPAWVVFSVLAPCSGGSNTLHPLKLTWLPGHLICNGASSGSLKFLPLYQLYLLPHNIWIIILKTRPLPKGVEWCLLMSSKVNFPNSIGVEEAQAILMLLFPSRYEANGSSLKWLSTIKLAGWAELRFFSSCLSKASIWSCTRYMSFLKCGGLANLRPDLL